MLALLTRFDGRITRSEFWYGNVLLLIPPLACELLLVRLGIASDSPSASTISALIAIATLVPAAALILKRGRDLEMRSSHLRFAIGVMVTGTLVNLARQAGQLDGLMTLPGAFLGAALFGGIGVATLVWMILGLGCTPGKRASDAPEARL